MRLAPQQRLKYVPKEPYKCGLGGARPIVDAIRLFNSQHGTAYRRLVGVGGGIFALVLVATLGLGTQPGWAQRIFFIIATGPTGGTYFPIGEAIAGLVSHPPGLHRCRIAGVCGPSGLIASARTSAGAIANVIDVNAHRVNSGLAQADVVAEAVAGKGAFTKIGPQRQIAVIAALFPRIFIWWRPRRRISPRSPQLKGKRVSLGDAGSGTNVTARAVLAAYRIAPWRIKAQRAAVGRGRGRARKGASSMPSSSSAARRSGWCAIWSRAAMRCWCRSTAPVASGCLARVPSLNAARIAAGRYPGLWRDRDRQRAGAVGRQ